MTRRVRSKVIGLDFDGTCVKNKYPEIGASIGAERWLVHLHKTFDIQYILWTMRTGKEAGEARLWFHNNQIPLLAVNVNPSQHTWSQSKKMYANVYVDDTALGMPLYRIERKPYVNWDLAGPMLEDWCAQHAKLRTNK